MKDRVHRRARELAVLSGRIPPELTQADIDRAERELSGGGEPDEGDERMDALEPMRWDPVASQGGAGQGISATG